MSVCNGRAEAAGSRAAESKNENGKAVKGIAAESKNENGKAVKGIAAVSKNRNGEAVKGRAVMFAALSSGSGKTLITCGMLRLLQKRGLAPVSFKCGPDYIDPMFHRTVIGVEASNIDLFFCGEKDAKSLFAENSEGFSISVAEGVMGYYDGLSAASHEASSYHVAKTLKLPVVMIINAKGQSLSALAVLKGMKEFRGDSRIEGVIFNNMSSHVYEALKTVTEEETGVKPLGYLPRVAELTIESRHLGLVRPEEIKDLSEKLDKLAEIMEETVDVDGLIKLASSYEFDKTEDGFSRLPGVTPKIAVARDEAFCFYYKDNISILKKLGAEIEEFSPLRDKELPEGACGLLLGGGYPELYCKELCGNEAMKSSVRKALESGMPCLAECGGFMYLHDKLEDMEGRHHDGVGFIDGRAYRTDRLGRFGYIELEAEEDSAFAVKGEKVRGHEFHYFDSESCGGSFKAVKPVTGKSWKCVNVRGSVMAGFPHLFYRSNPKIAERFLRAAAEYGKREEKK